MNLVIVESPTKAKTIAKFLGKKYSVKSSFGHVRDLPKSNMGIDIENDFKPKYVIPAKAREKVRDLKEAAAKAEEVILASDEDREGEAIAWHLAETLKLDPKKTKRIVFHEITKGAIEKAIAHPRKIDTRLVDAQQARRILDRLVGYELSPFLWSKIKYGLSAGRVQSVALRFIVEREKERTAFEQESYWKIEADLLAGFDHPSFRAQLTHIDGEKIDQTKTLNLFAGDYKASFTSIRDEADARRIASELRDSKAVVESSEKKETRRSPSPPFTTSTLQQSAINQLGFSSKQTMTLAQKLYEEGLITYMRTDSVNLSPESVSAIGETIRERFGQRYALDAPRYFKKASKGAQEAHEAIRPTDCRTAPDSLRDALDRNLWRLYELIWKRAVACQMADAVIASSKIVLTSGKYALAATGATISFDGYLAVYPEKISENEIPELKEGETAVIKTTEPLEKKTALPPRYTEASLVKVLEDRGIGRPSTYAPTISTLFDREYLDRDESKRLFPLEIGTLVSDLLSEHFQEIVDIDFTANMESSLDEIADDGKEWQPIIRDFYMPFRKHLEEKKSEVKKEDLLEKVGRSCPECSGDLLFRHGRFGKFISCSKYPECRYTEKSEEDKALQEQYAGEKCEKCGNDMVVKRGRFGSFLGCSHYPGCKNIKKIEKTTGVKCPSCQTGDIVERKSKKGRPFFGCNRYPKCEFALWSKPTGEQCEKCGSLMIFAAKGEKRCSNKECS